MHLHRFLDVSGFDFRLYSQVGLKNRIITCQSEKKFCFWSCSLFEHVEIFLIWRLAVSGWRFKSLIEKPALGLLAPWCSRTRACFCRACLGIPGSLRIVSVGQWFSRGSRGPLSRTRGEEPVSQLHQRALPCFFALLAVVRAEVFIDPGRRIHT